jgi:hypothetical protein
VTADISQAVRPAPFGQLAVLLNAAQQGFRQCRYRQLAANLPALISAASASREQATGHIRRRLDDLLAGSYRLASEVCVKLNDDAIAWVLADRALAAARQAGNPVGLAESARCVAVAMRRGGHHDGAIDLLTSTAHTISPDDARPPSAAVLVARGAMLCTAAYSAAQHGKASLAVDLIDEAAEAAARLPTGLPAGDNPFGPTNVAIYKIAIFTVIGETGTALTQAERISVHHLPTPERRGRYLIDTARAWLRHGAYDRACQAVLAAEHHAPQDVLRPSVRDLVGQLLYAPAPTPAGLRDLAARTGAAHH